jgi:hypothetical protein
MINSETAAPNNNIIPGSGTGVTPPLDAEVMIPPEPVLLPELEVLPVIRPPVEPVLMLPELVLPDEPVLVTLPEEPLPELVLPELVLTPPDELMPPLPENPPLDIIKDCPPPMICVDCGTGEVYGASGVKGTYGFCTWEGHALTNAW